MLIIVIFQGGSPFGEEAKKGETMGGRAIVRTVMESGFWLVLLYRYRKACSIMMVALLLHKLATFDWAHMIAYWRLLREWTRQDKPVVYTPPPAAERRRLPVISFHGAGTYAFYYIGIAEALQRRLDADAQRRCCYEGVSSGALLATLLACDAKVGEVADAFEQAVQAARPACWLVWQEARARFRAVQSSVVRRHLRDDAVRALNAALPGGRGRLKIFVFDFLRMGAVGNDHWFDGAHLLEWLLAAMSIPCVTSLPRWIRLPRRQGQDNNNPAYDWILAMDAFSTHRALWQRDASIKRIAVSPLDVRCTLSPVHPTSRYLRLPYTHALIRQPLALQHYLRQSGCAQMQAYIDQNPHVFFP